MTVIFPLNGCGTPVENQLIIDVWVYFWTLHFVPLIYVPVFVPIPQYLNWYCFLVSFEIIKCESFLFFFRRIILGILACQVGF